MKTFEDFRPYFPELKNELRDEFDGNFTNPNDLYFSSHLTFSRGSWRKEGEWLFEIDFEVIIEGGYDEDEPGRFYPIKCRGCVTDIYGGWSNDDDEDYEYDPTEEEIREITDYIENEVIPTFRECVAEKIEMKDEYYY